MTPRPAGRTSAVELPNEWYVACLATELGRRRPLARTVLGTPLCLFRDGDGVAAAVIDRCPHRNVPLSLGRLRDGLLECRYHGWRFDASGACRAIPGLCAEFSPSGARGRAADAVPCVEQDGFVWVFPGPDEPSAGRPPFRFPCVGDPGYDTVRRSLTSAGTVHAVAENALDVPHTAFLHGGLFRGAGRGPVEIEAAVRSWSDRVEAEYIGEPVPPGVAGRLLAPGGGVVQHWDRFILPSIAQVEYRLEDNHLLVTSALTPITPTETRLHSAVTFRLRVPHGLIKTLLPPLARLIFAQDARILRRQAETIERFGGEQFASTEIDVLGPGILRLLRRAERGEPDDPSDDPPPERRLRLRV
ncbi:MAG TPA: aromatic ring-hydroxylating dioxygenase subunit alpha [Acidimicrobiia bacterium]|nr:aromatic ring-hydroxylating dioxygenase subunit alpha [Acidimicrobiia bacterium]